MAIEAFMYPTFCLPAITPVSFANSLLHRSPMVARLGPSFMNEVEVGAAGMRDPNNILERARPSKAVSGQRSRGDRDLAWFGSGQPGIFLEFELASRLVDPIPPEGRPRFKIPLPHA